jgi:hypothetical protein
MRLLERCDEIVRIIDETLGDIDETTSRSLNLNVVMDDSSESATMSAGNHRLTGRGLEP